MIWIAPSEKDIATETAVKTSMGRRHTRDLLLPRLLSAQLNLQEN